jgi:integrase
LRNHTFSALGDLDVAAIETAHILKVLQAIWLGKTATAVRIRQRIEQVLDYAAVHGSRPAGALNPARWKGHLDQLLAKPSRAAPVTHHRAIDYRKLPAFMSALRAREGIAARALEFTILTAARTSEVLGATWGEINFTEATWTVAGPRMKSGREHRVALSPAAIDLLRALPLERDNNFIFIGSLAGRGLNDLALARTMARMGHGETVHGFRSAFSDWAHEQTAHSNHTIEISLAHRVGSDVEQAYRRGTMFAKRVKLMTDWAKHCDSNLVAMGDNVTAIGGAR